MQTIAQTDKRSAKPAPNAPKQDLRAWVDALRAAGELQEINGAEREAEIGGIVDLHMRKMGNPAVLFDDIPGYPHGHRILANILTSVRRINLTVGMPMDGSAIDDAIGVPGAVTQLPVTPQRLKENLTERTSPLPCSRAAS